MIPLLALEFNHLLAVWPELRTILMTLPSMMKVSLILTR